MIEPSEIADPVQIKDALSDKRKAADTLKTIALLDSDRIDIILEAVRPLTVSGIKVAQTVMVTKKDIASPEGIDKAVSFAKETNPEAIIVKASISKLLSETLIEVLLQCRNR